MNPVYIQTALDLNGYCIVPNVLTSDEVVSAKQSFQNWQATIPNHDETHNTANPHGIYKHHRAGHTRHAWFIRTRPSVQQIFRDLWKTDDLIVSFDGSCYISKDTRKKDKCWTHTDQAPTKKGVHCYQGLVSLTDNQERTLVVYEGTHLLHESYFHDRGIQNTKDWNLLDKTYVESIADKKRVLNIPAGSLVLWDSRIFHQNQYGKPDSEERFVQYICYLPKNHLKNTPAMAKKRQKYLEERRTTSHWPAPIHVNGLQPQVYGDKSRLIDYSQLPSPNISDMSEEIQKLI